MKPFLTLLFTTFIVISYAQPGTVDKTYGENKAGTVTTATQAYINPTALQPDDKLLTGGTGSGTRQYFLSRHNKDGSLDSSFGVAGAVITLFDDLIESLLQINGWQAIAVQPDGKIVAAGTASKYKIDVPGDFPFEADIVLARFETNGALDSSFGNNGRLGTDLGLQEIATTIAVQADGKILVGGYQQETSNGDGSHILLMRYNSDGRLDESFNQGKGYVTYFKETGFTHALLVQPNGRILIGGSYNINEEFFMVRYQPDGKIDADFGNVGEVRTSFGNGIQGTYINSLTLDENGRIIAAGVVDSYMKGEVVRYLPDGSLDNSFGEGGIVELTLTEAPYIYLNTVLAQPQGRLVVVGVIAGNAYTSWTPFLEGLNADGSPDASFGTNNGHAIADFGFGEQVSVRAVMQQDGKIIISGNKPYSTNPDERGYTLARYNGYPTRVPLYVRIKRWLQNHGISWKGLPQENNVAYYSIERSNNSTTGFTQIAKVSGVNHLNNYDITNSNLLQGTNYYRIKAVSTDGTIRYSEVVSADNSAATASVYPNPVRDYVRVQGLRSNEQANISIANTNGTVVARGVSNGSTQYRTAAGNLQRGTYYLNITSGGKTETLKFVKE